MKIKGKIGKIMIIGIMLIIVAAAAIFSIQTKNGKEVETYTVGKGEIQSFVEEIATVKSNSQRKVYSEATGEIIKINIDIGDKVNKGDILAEMDVEDIDLQIKSMESKLKALKAAYAEAIKMPDEELINKAEANVESIKISVDEARRNVENNKKLYEEGAISFDNYQKAVNYLQMQEEALKVAESEVQMLQKGPSQNVIAQYKAQIEEMGYQLDLLKKNKASFVLISPTDGTVLEKLVEEGEFVQTGMPVIEIGDEGDLYLEADILISEIGDIKEGADVIIYNDNLNIDNLKGKVRKIHPKAFNKLSDLGIEQKRVKVEIDIEDKTDDLKIDYESNVKIITHKKKNVVIIPDDSIVEYEDGKYVYVIDKEETILRKIETGIEGDDMVEVVSGLDEGDEIVLNPDSEQ